MLKLKIFNSEKVVDQPLTLALEAVGDTIELCAVNSCGHRVNQGSILKVQPDGQIKLCGRVSKELGLQLDAERRVITC